MSKIISNLNRYSDDRGISWTISNDVPVWKYFTVRPINVVLFKSGNGLLVVERENYPDNALILNPDGTVRIRVKNPEIDGGAKAFADACYVFDELTLIVAFSSRQLACVIDEEGNILRKYETR